MFKNNSKYIKVIYIFLFVVTIMVTIVALSYAYITAAINNSASTNISFYSNRTNYYMNSTNVDNITFSLTDNMAYGVDDNQDIQIYTKSFPYSIYGPSDVTIANCTLYFSFLYDNTSYAYVDNNSFYFYVAGKTFNLPSKPSSGLVASVGSYNANFRMGTQFNVRIDMYFKNISYTDQSALVGKTIKGSLYVSSLNCTKVS